MPHRTLHQLAREYLVEKYVLMIEDDILRTEGIINEAGDDKPVRKDLAEARLVALKVLLQRIKDTWEEHGNG